MAKFGIVMTTYHRPDGSTYEKIKKSIQSITSQTFSDWRLYLIGDHYTDYEEFDKICSLVPESKITAINLPFAAERESGKFTGHALWCSAGKNASNTGILKSIEEGCEFHCHLDDDDEWLPHHLDTLNYAYNNFNEAVFIYTNSTYLGRLMPPFVVSPLLEYDNLPPAPEKLVHSSVSWRLDKIPLLHRDTIEQGRVFPGDADMWERIGNYCRDKGLKTLYVPITTVLKEDEKSMLK